MPRIQRASTQRRGAVDTPSTPQGAKFGVSTHAGHRGAQPERQRQRREWRDARSRRGRARTPRYQVSGRDGVLALRRTDAPHERRPCDDRRAANDSRPRCVGARPWRSPAWSVVANLRRAAMLESRSPHDAPTAPTGALHGAHRSQVPTSLRARGVPCRARAGRGDDDESRRRPGARLSDEHEGDEEGDHEAHEAAEGEAHRMPAQRHHPEAAEAKEVTT
jgi:hypothetical protein